MAAAGLFHTAAGVEAQGSASPAWGRMHALWAIPTACCIHLKHGREIASPALRWLVVIRICSYSDQGYAGWRERDLTTSWRFETSDRASKMSHELLSRHYWDKASCNTSVSRLPIVAHLIRLLLSYVAVGCPSLCMISKELSHVAFPYGSCFRIRSRRPHALSVCRACELGT